MNVPQDLFPEFKRPKNILEGFVELLAFPTLELAPAVYERVRQGERKGNQRCFPRSGRLSRGTGCRLLRQRALGNGAGTAGTKPQ